MFQDLPWYPSPARVMPFSRSAIILLPADRVHQRGSLVHERGTCHGQRYSLLLEMNPLISRRTTHGVSRSVGVRGSILLARWRNRTAAPRRERGPGRTLGSAEGRISPIPKGLASFRVVQAMRPISRRRSPAPKADDRRQGPRSSAAGEQSGDNRRIWQALGGQRRRKAGEGHQLVEAGGQETEPRRTSGPGAELHPGCGLARLPPDRSRFHTASGKSRPTPATAGGHCAVRCVQRPLIAFAKSWRGKMRT